VRTGFVGVGWMGLPMCANLLLAGYDVTAGMRAELQSAVLSCGAPWASPPARVAAQADVLITMVPGQREVYDVMARPFSLL
jgi:3-hydroxyisobutyrate dehydrogenase